MTLIYPLQGASSFTDVLASCLPAPFGQSMILETGAGAKS